MSRVFVTAITPHEIASWVAAAGFALAGGLAAYETGEPAVALASVFLCAAFWSNTRRDLSIGMRIAALVLQLLKTGQLALLGALLIFAGDGSWIAHAAVSSWPAWLSGALLLSGAVATTGAWRRFLDLRPHPAAVRPPRRRRDRVKG